MKSLSRAAVIAAVRAQKRGRRSRFNDLHRPLFVKAFARRNVEKNR